MKVALVDDDADSVERLEKLLQNNIGSSVSVKRFSSGEEFLSSFTPESYDFIVLDIFMGKLTGIETARKIRETDKKVKLIFCSSSNEFAFESYEVGACYYLRKPYTDENFCAMLDRVELDKLELMRSIKLPDGQQIVLRGIVYADFSSHCMTFHCKNGSDVISRISFAQTEPLLCGYPYFCSPSKGVIVNFYEVRSMVDDIFLMSGNARVSISRRKLKEVKEAYANFRFNLLRNGGDE